MARADILRIYKFAYTSIQCQQLAIEFHEIRGNVVLQRGGKFIGERKKMKMKEKTSRIKNVFGCFT